MRAAVLQGPDLPLAVTEVDEPVPGDGDLLLRVDACGICGSDIHIADALPLPGLVLGHEFCGTVEAVGGGVEGWAVGDRAAGLPLSTCGRCAACLSGRPRKCATAQMIGIERPGAFAELVAIPAASAFRLPRGLDARHGALVEPLAVGLHTVDRAGISPGDDVLVLGGGPVGLAVALWLQHLGAREVGLSDPVASRRDLAAQLGATATFDPGAGDVGAAFAEVAGAPPAVVIECVGVPGLIQHACDLVAIDGTVVVAGVCIGDDQLVPLVPLQKEIDLRFAFYYRTRDWDLTLRALDDRRIDPLPLVTHEIDLDAVPERFAALAHPTTECKVLIRP